LKKALITGIAGQDGSYLAELLLEKGYEVHGIELPVPAGEERRLDNLAQIRERLSLDFGSVADAAFMAGVIERVRPDECYHLAAASFVSYLFEEEAATLNNNLQSQHCLLATLKQLAPQCRLFFAGTSEMFGAVTASPQNEQTAFNPRSIYGISKVAGHHLLDYYRKQHGLLACTGILYNHESPRRGLQFVTRKITATAASISRGLEQKLYLGNLDAVRDWGSASDYVRAMWLMLQQDVPADYVIATGENRSVREFVDAAFRRVGLDYREYVEVDPRFYRETEPVALCGDCSRLEGELGWQRLKSFEEIVAEMVERDLVLLSADPAAGEK
jgi:GDPmannose 4,6-dehydratase